MNPQDLLEQPGKSTRQGGRRPMVRPRTVVSCATASLVASLGCSRAPVPPAAHTSSESGPSCGHFSASGKSPLIDDFEADPNRILSHEGRGGWWFVYDDGSGGKVDRQEVVTETGRVLRVVASGFRSWGAGFGASLHPASTPTHACLYDASVYSGVRLRVRGRGRLRLSLADERGTPVTLGGACARPGIACYDRPAVWVDLEAGWKTHEFPFCAFWPEGWGGPPQSLDTSRLFAVLFQVDAREEVEAWLDDLSFYRVPGDAAAPRCGAPCPLESVPSSARIEPLFSTAPLSHELSVHTFAQATRSCGSLTRRYLSYVPERLGQRSSAPVLIMLHGSGANAESARSFQARDRFDALAARDGFVVVYGNAAPSSRTSPDPAFPNTGSWRQGIFDDGQVDDVEYLQRVLEDLAARGVIDGHNPVYMTGLSSGGGMVLEAARRMPERISGFAALMPYDGEQPKPAPDLASAPLRRALFAYSIGDPGLAPGSHDILRPLPAQWAVAMGIPREITQAPRATPLPNRVVEGQTYAGQDGIALATRDSRVTQLDMVSSGAYVRVMVMEHAGHFWPNPLPDTEPWVLDRWGFRNQDFDTADAVWEFLSAAPAPD